MPSGPAGSTKLNISNSLSYISSCLQPALFSISLLHILSSPLHHSTPLTSMATNGTKPRERKMSTSAPISDLKGPVSYPFLSSLLLRTDQLVSGWPGLYVPPKAQTYCYRLWCWRDQECGIEHSRRPERCVSQYYGQFDANCH